MWWTCHRRGYFGAEIRINLGKRGDDSAHQVKDQKAKRAHLIFDIVPKDPEIQHIPEKMQPSAVKENRREERHDHPEIRMLRCIDVHLGGTHSEHSDEFPEPFSK